MTDRPRYDRARHIAGLSPHQAAKMLGVPLEDLQAFESGIEVPTLDAAALAKLYRVRIEWLTGDVPQHDYGVVDAMKGADKLTPHDRDVVAEFAAMLDKRRVPDVEKFDEHEFVGSDCDCRLCGEGRMHYLHAERGGV